MNLNKTLTSLSSLALIVLSFTALGNTQLIDISSGSSKVSTIYSDKHKTEITIYNNTQETVTAKGAGSPVSVIMKPGDVNHLFSDKKEYDIVFLTLSRGSETFFSDFVRNHAILKVSDYLPNAKSKNG